jgi:hypothetical protein
LILKIISKPDCSDNIIVGSPLIRTLFPMGENMQEKIIKGHLYQSFISYVEQASLHFKSSVFDKRTDNVVYISRPYQICTIVEQLEQRGHYVASLVML